jgi:hypothetical protein
MDAAFRLSRLWRVRACRRHRSLVSQNLGNWTYYLHVLSGTINFSYAVIPFTPGFENDYLYLGWIVGGNIAACLAVMWAGQTHARMKARSA